MIHEEFPCLLIHEADHQLQGYPVAQRCVELNPSIHLVRPYVENFDIRLAAPAEWRLPSITFFIRLSSFLCFLLFFHAFIFRLLALCLRPSLI
jgi:hypothetical protein